MNKNPAIEANGRQPEHGTWEEHILTCGEEMNAEENMDGTKATLLEILEDRAARILENEKDILAVKRVLAILDADVKRVLAILNAEQSTGEESEAGAEETDKADETEPKPKDEETQEGPHTGPADPFSDSLSMPMDRLKEIVRDPEAAAAIFVQARGGEPLECPKCGSNAHTKRAPGINHRPDLFRCTPCKTEFGIKTGTVMHGSRETLGNWLVAIKLMADTGGKASARDLWDLTGTGAGFATDMIEAIRSEMDSPSGLLAAVIRSEMDSPGGLLTAVARVGERAKTHEETDTGQEKPGPERPSRETLGQKTEPGAAARAAPPSGPITELSPEEMIALAGDDITCTELFMAARDQGGIDCPRCGLREETKRIGPSRPIQFRCGICNSVYSVRTGTPMEGPRSPWQNGRWPGTWPPPGGRRRTMRNWPCCLERPGAWPGESWTRRPGYARRAKTPSRRWPGSRRPAPRTARRTPLPRKPEQRPRQTRQRAKSGQTNQGPARRTAASPAAPGQRNSRRKANPSPARTSSARTGRGVSHRWGSRGQA